MIVSLAEIEKWQLESVRDVSRAASDGVAATADTRRRLSALPYADWEGDAALSARTATGRIQIDLDAYGNLMTVVASATAKAADDIAVLRRTLSLLYVDADNWGFTIDTATNSLFAVGETRAAQHDELLERIATLLADANTVDDDLARIIDYADGDLPVPPMRDDVRAILAGQASPPADPGTFNRWWTNLSPLEKDALWERDQYLGNHGGMPAADRDHYNRRKLDDEYTRAAMAHNAGLPSDYDDLRAIKKQLEADDRLLLLLDTQTGVRPHAAIASGNPDTADNVATFVPGTGSRPSKMGTDMLRVEAMQTAAGPNTSVIAWFGYDAPQSIWNDAPQHEFAADAAPRLERFQDGLRASHEGEPSNNTVIGHSYGTTVVGAAASGGHVLDADQVVFVASPGSSVDHATELHLTGVQTSEMGDRVFATKAAHDPVPLYADTHNGTLGTALVAGTSSLPVVGPLVGTYIATRTDDFGIDPTDTEFGATTFESDPGTATTIRGVSTYHPDAHSEYWTADNAALKNMGSIIGGRGTVS